MAAGHLQGDPAHEKVAGENGKKSDEELGEQVGASFEKLTGKEKLHDFIHHGREGRKAAQESRHQKRGGKGGGKVLGEEAGEEADQERAGPIDDERAIGEAASKKGGGDQGDGVSRECAQCAA